MIGFISGVVPQWLAARTTWRSQRGQGLTEYALLLALIAVVVVVVLVVVGKQTSNLYSNVNNAF